MIFAIIIKEKIKRISECLKITQNVSFEFLQFCHFSPFFVQLSTQNVSASLALLNDTFSVIFKHREFLFYLN